MNVLQIISAIVLILVSAIIIALVLAQNSNGNGLSGVIAGGEAANNVGRGRSKDALLAKYTKIAGGVFIVVTILVSVLSAIASK